MSATLSMVDDRTIVRIPFESREEAIQAAANLPISVGKVTDPDGFEMFLSYVGDHLIGWHETAEEAHITAAKFDRRNLLD